MGAVAAAAVYFTVFHYYSLVTGTWCHCHCHYPAGHYYACHNAI